IRQALARFRPAFRQHPAARSPARDQQDLDAILTRPPRQRRDLHAAWLAAKKLAQPFRDQGSFAATDEHAFTRDSVFSFATLSISGLTIGIKSKNSTIQGIFPADIGQPPEPILQS